MVKKFIAFITILCFILSVPCRALADDRLEENIAIKDIDEAITVSNNIDSEPVISSRIAVVYDRKSKKILWGKNENKKTAMASTTKIMTCIVVLENANLSDEVTISAKAAGTGGSRLNLKKNDKITVLDLLYGLMLRSGNDAAVALAEHVGGDVNGFIELMNQKAQELKLQNTHFVTPHGLDDPEHYTTALELAKIADYAMENEAFAKIVNTKNYTISVNNNARTINNTNELLGYLNGVNGVKTGFTNNAGRCLVTSINRNGFQLITVVLGADTKKIRTADSIKLIEYAYKEYKEVNIENIIKEKFSDWKKINEKQIQVIKGKNDNIEITIEEITNKVIPMKEEDKDKIDVEINCLNILKAPVEKGKVIGQMKVTLKGEVLETINIINCAENLKKDKYDYFREFLKVIYE